MEVEGLARLMPVEQKTVSDARTMSLFFEDCRDVEVLFGSRSALATVAEALRESRSYERHDDLLSLAGILLSHNSFDAGGIVPGAAPFSWFVNLSNLFERSIRSRLDAITPRSVPVAKGFTFGASVFPEKH